MAEQNGQNKVKHDVFIVYSSKDRSSVTEDILPALQNAKFKVIYDNDFLPGRSAFKNITEAVFGSEKTLIFLTKDSLQSTWCRLELQVALEKTQKENIHSVVLLLHGLDRNEVATLQFLRIAPKVEMIPGNQSWVGELVQALKTDISVNDLLPVGTVGHGYAYSHFNGYLQYVLPGLKKMVVNSQWYSTNRMPAVLFEMIPQTCKCPAKLTDVDPDIKQVGLEKIKHHSSGNFREINVPVYSVTDENGVEYYCICEYPSVIRALHIMDTNHLASITDEERRLQLVRFYFTMNGILHNTYLEGVGRGKLLLFNDEKEKPKDVLLRAIKRELSIVDMDEDDTIGPLSRLTSGIQTMTMHEDLEFDVFIARPCENDRDVCQEIMAHLRTNGITFLATTDMPGKTLIQSIRAGLQKCRWFILIYSEYVLHSGWLSLECLLAIQECVAKNNVCLIPVLKGVDHTKIPDSLAWITFVDSSDGQYLKKIESALKNIPIELETMLPAGNVSDGLAWGYFANYLEFILPALPTKIQQIFDGQADINCPKKLLLLIPSSCYCPPKLTDSDDRIQSYKHVVIDERDIGGNEARQYHCDIYKIQEYFFVGQFPAPIQCLRKMNDMRIAGLKERDMFQEADAFCTKIKIILQKQNIADKCSFLAYDDKKGKAGDVVLEEIKRSLNGV